MARSKGYLKINATKKSFDYVTEDFIYEDVCPYFEATGFIRNINAKKDEFPKLKIAYNDHDKTQGEFIMDCSSLGDINVFDTLCNGKGLFVKAMHISAALELLQTQARELRWDATKTEYRHTKLGWHNIDGNDCFLYDDNTMVNGHRSICERDFQFTAGSREIYEQLLRETVFPSKELTLAYILGFSAVVVSRLDKLKIVELGTIVVNVSGKSSIGKSTIEQLMISPFGCPVFSKNCLGITHAGTCNGILDALEGIHGLPRVPHEAEAIQIMFQMIADGFSYRATVNYLNEKGYRRRDGRLLSYNITDTLRNRQYTGEYVFNQYKRKPARKWRTQRKMETEVVRIQGGMPAIVDEETFEKVQALLDKRRQKNGRGRRKGKYLLSGLTVCGVCGSAVSGGKTISRGKNHFAYICTSKRHTQRKSINLVYLDKYVVGLFTQAFLLLRNTESVIELMRRSLAIQHDEKVKRLKALKKEQEEKRLLLVSLDEIIKANKGKALATVIENNRKEEQQAFDSLTEKIAKLQAERTALPRFNKDTVRRNMREYKTVLESIDFYKKQEILQTLVDEIKIGNETVETKINLHALAGIEIPLTCVVVERLENVKSVYALRGMDFDLQEMEIRTGENQSNDTFQGGES